MKFIISLMAVLLLVVSSVKAQQTKVVNGTVTDIKDGTPLTGVTVSVKGSNTATQTGKDGAFSINVPAAAKALVFSYVGYGLQEVAISNNMSVQLTPTLRNLNEVVVVAYGTQKRSEITSAISTVNADAIKNQQVVSVGQALQGTAPGVLVINTSGQPGDNPIIRIRGVASISASADPLVVLDGVPFDVIIKQEKMNRVEKVRAVLILFFL